MIRWAQQSSLLQMFSDFSPGEVFGYAFRALHMSRTMFTDVTYYIVLQCFENNERRTRQTWKCRRMCTYSIAQRMCTLPNECRVMTQNSSLHTTSLITVPLVHLNRSLLIKFSNSLRQKEETDFTLNMWF